MHTCTHMHNHIHAATSMCKPHKLTHTFMHVCTHMHNHTHTCSHTTTHKHHVPVHTTTYTYHTVHTYIRTPAPAYTQVTTCMHTCTCTHTQQHTCACTHVCAHTCTHPLNSLSSLASLWAEGLSQGQSPQPRKGVSCVTSPPGPSEGENLDLGGEGVEEGRSMTLQLPRRGGRPSVSGDLAQACGGTGGSLPSLKRHLGEAPHV